jgi:hypothetical protein
MLAAWGAQMGDPIDRAQQALEAARHQIRLGHHETDNYWAEEALSEAKEESGAAKRKRRHGVRPIPRCGLRERSL